MEDLRAKYELGQAIIGEFNQKEFIKLFDRILRVRNILTSFDEFENDTQLTERGLQDYQSVYMTSTKTLRVSKLLIRKISMKI